MSKKKKKRQKANKNITKQNILQMPICVYIYIEREREIIMWVKIKMDKLGYTLTSLREQKQRKGRNNSLVWESGSLQTIVLSSPVPYSA